MIFISERHWEGMRMAVLEDKVILVTGAAGGIGRECAKFAAKQGAKVVVNDFGGSVRGGDNGSPDPAQLVAAEIRDAGGEAVANVDSVSDPSGARHMVEAALDHFKRIDGVINTAGILRDVMFHEMTEDDWDTVIAVHLKGAYNVSRAAINRFREQESGAFVHFTSTSGLIGQPAQAHYASAKMGVVGLSRVLAMEGASKNIRSNVVAPFAWTRMIPAILMMENVTPEHAEHFKSTMRADQMAPPVIALLSDAAKDVTGQIFAIRGNEIFLMSQPRPVRTIARLEGWTAEAVLNHCLPAMKASFTDLGDSVAVFNWDFI
jgi:NAD(P)-dependent dehydrogenase (short-subunit alcohol dehydrogenase family)